jgi:CubicO group peptidase (beta-lactamase class C family)
MLWGPLGMTRTTWQTVVDDPNVAEYPQSTYGGERPGARKRRIGERNDTCAHLAPCPMGNGANFSTAPDMLLFAADLLRRERFPKAYYDLLFAPSFDGDGHRRSFGWDMTAAKSTFTSWTKTAFSDKAICHTGWTGPAIAVDPVRDFAGVVLGNRLASKQKTMDPRLHLLDLMA